MCRQSHRHMSLVESLSIDLENVSTFEMLEEWIGKNKAEITEEDIKYFDSYYKTAPEIEPDNLYGTKHTASIWYEWYPEY